MDLSALLISSFLAACCKFVICPLLECVAAMSLFLWAVCLRKLDLGGLVIITSIDCLFGWFNSWLVGSNNFLLDIAYFLI